MEQFIEKKMEQFIEKKMEEDLLKSNLFNGRNGEV